MRGLIGPVRQPEMAAVPITLLFLKMQKYYVEGVTAGGVKG